MINKAERKQMQSADDNVIIKHSPARLQKIHKKHRNGMENIQKRKESADKHLNINSFFWK